MPTDLITSSPSTDLVLEQGTGTSASPLDLPAAVFQAALERRQHNRQSLMAWLRSALLEGVDCGKLHTAGKGRCRYAAQGRPAECPDPSHWSKASLWKPGAEKICGMLGVTVHYPTLNAYEQAALQGIEPKAILLRCELREASGRVVAEGVGARSLAQDGGDLNKSLKMAEKSAMIDATLRMAGLSEVFTQDLEDLRGEVPPAAVPVATTPPVPQAVVRPDEPDDLAAQLRHFQLDPQRVLAWCQRRWGMGDFAALDAAQQQELRRRLPDFARQAAAGSPAKAVPVALATSTSAGAVPAPLQQQLERQARLKGVPVPAVATLEQAKAELQRLFQLPPTASAA